MFRLNMLINKVIFSLIVGLFLLAGCGQKGPLYLPDNNFNEASKVYYNIQDGS